MSDRKCLRFFSDAFENGIESLDARYKGRCQELSFDFVCSPSDMQWADPELKVTRQTAVDWGLAKAVADANPFAHTGYKLASLLLWMDQPLIESLAGELTSQGAIAGDALRK